MKYRIDNQFALSDQPNGPLVPLLKGIAETLCEHQYAKGTIQNHLRNIVRFSAWLEQENDGTTPRWCIFITSVASRAKTESRSFAVISPPPDCPVGTFMPMQHG